MFDNTQNEAASSSTADQSQVTTKSSSVHVVITGKGGVGKSTCAAFLAQALMENGTKVTVFDLDPIQNSITKFKALNVITVPVLDGEISNVDALDDVMECLLYESGDFVLDVGGGSFISVNSWVLRDDVVDILTSAGKRCVFHVVIAGGTSLIDTMRHLDSMLSQMPEAAEFVVWTNPHTGSLAHNGVEFHDSPFFERVKDRLAGLVDLPKLDANYAAPALARLLVESLTFAEAAEDPRLRHAEKARLAKIWAPIKERIQYVI